MSEGFRARGREREDERGDDVEGRVVCGIQPVREALRVHGAKVTRLYLEAGDNPRLAALGRLARDTGVAVSGAMRGELDRLARGVHHQGALAIAPPLPTIELDLLMTPEAALVVLDGITDPQNFGAILRCAVALGSGGVVFGESQAAPLTAATFRASAGAVEHAKLCRVRSLRSAVSRLVSSGVTVVSLEADAETCLSELELRGPAAVIVGAEDKGVGKAVRQLASARARLPMNGVLDSLNASAACAVALYEIRRQRG